MAADGGKEEGTVLQFAPFTSAVDSVFWHRLKDKKLDVYHLDDKPKSLLGYYVNSDLAGLPCRLNVDYSAFENGALPKRACQVQGMLINTNTMDTFKTLDKISLMESAGQRIWDAITKREVLENPSLLCQFLLITFADLKKYNFYYWFAFPALCTEDKTKLMAEPHPVNSIFDESQMADLQASYDSLCKLGQGWYLWATVRMTHLRFWIQLDLAMRLAFNSIGPGACSNAFFLVKRNSGKVECTHLKEIDTLLQQNTEFMVAFADPSTLPANPGWPLRNLLVFLALHWGSRMPKLQVLCFRDRFRGGRHEIDHSLVLDVSLPKITESECPKYVGWEKNKKQKLGPRSVNLSDTMDPEKLAESSVDLNLKLMRWRLLPSLDLDIVSGTRCLLLGAGTLGCNVARCLMAWGVRTITFVDNGRISYSNPVRQTLFEFEDCKGRGQPKAEAAAQALRKIFPGVNSSSEMLSIPMPGHAIGDSPEAIASVQRDVTKLEELIDSHDVIFLLLDTRESRWLPTVIGAAKQKLVLTAALGFDTFLVMRHGARVLLGNDSPAPSAARDLTCLPGSDLGCYFCNDVVAPGDSTRDRTLDQQCTVSRPGVSFIASSLAVELMISILQHPQRGQAAADTSAKDQHLTAEMTSALGLVPHQVRGFLSRFHTVLPASLAFDKCTACSDKVITSYMSEGFSFLQKVFNVPTYLEDLTGLTELMAQTLVADVWEMSDEETLD